MKHPHVKRKLNLDKVTPGGEKGLSFLVKQCFGKPLDKTYQISNWEQRPLSQLQIRYAGMNVLSKFHAFPCDLHAFFYKEPVYKEPTCRRPKYLKNLYY